MRAPLSLLILVLLAFEVGAFIYFWPGSIHNIGTWLNFSVMAMMLTQNLAFFWVRKGKASVAMRAVSYFTTTLGFVVVGIALFHSTR
jgi:hypothetical protein